jgi:prepilin-type N-terminal cleavage/methylation domain-containing protein
MKRSSKKGFTLLEITIALAILTISVAILIDSQGSVAWMLEDTNKVRTATLLAEEKMTEAQLLLEEEGWKDSDIEENGDFANFGSEDWRQGNAQIEEDLEEFKWAYMIVVLN